MAFLHISNVTIKGISACVPRTVQENNLYPGFTNGEAEKFMAATGVRRKRRAGPEICTSDLCCQAAQKLITALN